MTQIHYKAATKMVIFWEKFENAKNFSILGSYTSLRVSQNFFPTDLTVRSKMSIIYDLY